MEPNYYEIIGKKIQNIRRQKLITQEQLAKQLNMSKVFLSRVERGKVKVSLQRLIEIAMALDIRLENLLAENTIINVGKMDYVTKEFEELLKKCTKKQKKFIYEVAELVVDMNI